MSFVYMMRGESPPIFVHYPVVLAYRLKEFSGSPGPCFTRHGLSMS